MYIGYDYFLLVVCLLSLVWLLVGSSRDEDALRRKVAEQIVTIERLERDKKDSSEKLSQLEARSKKFGERLFFHKFIKFWNYPSPLSAISENEVVSLEEVKKTKDAEIEKYKKYLSKAKKIIESFGGSAKSTPEDALEVRKREREKG